MRALALLVITMVVSGCRMLGYTPLPCDDDTHCQSGAVCVEHVCLIGSADAGATADDAGVPGDDAGIDLDAGIDVDAGVDGGFDDAGVDDAGTPDVDAGFPVDWWDLAFARRARIDLDNTLQTETLIDFPVLVVLDANTIDLTGVDGEGDDLRFVDADGVTELAHEIDSFDPFGISTIWVRVPTIEAASSSDFMWLYFGNADAVSTSFGPNVFSADYLATWHLDGDPSFGPSEQTDSSANAVHGSALNMSTFDVFPGVIGRGLHFNGIQIVRIDNSAVASPLATTAMPGTISAWIFAEGENGTVIARREGSEAQWHLAVENVNGGGMQLTFVWSDEFLVNCAFVANDPVATFAWHHVAVTIDPSGAPVAFYVDGARVEFFTFRACTGTPQPRAIDAAIGARWAGAPNPGFAFIGVIDEVRVEGPVRSDDWMRAQVLSMTGALAIVGALESL